MLYTMLTIKRDVYVNIIAISNIIHSEKEGHFQLSLEIQLQEFVWEIKLLDLKQEA